MSRLLQESLPRRNLLVLGLPRGGVPVAAEVARTFHAPLDVIAVRKVGAPGNPEYGIGAITEDGYAWIDPDLIQAFDLSDDEIKRTLQKKSAEIDQLILKLRDGKPISPLNGKTVLVVDDGIATGVTARVVADYLRTRGAERIVLAVPVCSADGAQMLSEHFDQVVCMEAPESFYAVGNWYEDFSQVSDEEVVRCLRELSGFLAAS